MESNKIDFQSLSYRLENEFAKYKSDYPKDFGTAFTKTLPLMFLLVGATMLFIATAMKYHDGATVTVSVVLIMVSGYMRLMFGKKEVTDPELRKNISGVRFDIEQNFGKYSDVKTYLDDFNAEFSRVQAYKAKVKKQLYVIQSVAYFILAVVFAFAVAMK